MIAHDIEGGYKETSDDRRVSGITDATDVSVIMDAVGFGRGISRAGGWLGTILVLHHLDEGATSVGGVGVPFDTEEMRCIVEVPSFAV